jgi:hypothetical protein
MVGRGWLVKPGAAPSIPSEVAMSHPARSNPSDRPRGAAIAIAVSLAALLLLTSCSAPGGSQPTTVTVRGRVLDELLSPIANASILIDGSVTTTAADGTFAANGVYAPYDVVVAPSGTTHAWDFEGLTRSDPTLSLYSVGTGHAATVAGTVGGGTLQSNEQAFLVPGGTTRTDRNVQMGPGGGSAFGPGYIAWNSVDPLDTTLYALGALFDNSGNPTSYTRFGSLAIALRDGDARTGLVIPTQAVQTAAVSGGLSAPSGYTLTGGRMLLRFGSGSAGAMLGIPLANLSLATGTFSNTMVPEASGIAYGVAGAASGPSGQGVLAWGEVSGPGQAATLTLPPGPSTTSPLGGAANVAAGATFSWTAVPGAVYMVDLSPHNNGSGNGLSIVTTQTSLTLPDLRAINRSLSANTQYDYGVWATGPFSSMDASAGPDGMWGFFYDLEGVFTGYPASAPAASGVIAPGWGSSSAYVSFTTAP